MRRIDQMKIEIMPIAIETNLHQLRKDGNPIKTIKIIYYCPTLIPLATNVLRTQQ